LNYIKRSKSYMLDSWSSIVINKLLDLWSFSSLSWFC